MELHGNGDLMQLAMEGAQFLEEFEAHLSTPEDYLNPSPELRSRCLAGVKTAFDLLQKHCRATDSREARSGAEGKNAARSGLGVPTGPLSELYVEGFDADQIWEQIQLVNEPMLAYLSKQVEKICHWDLKKLTQGDDRHKMKVALSDSESGSDGMGELESDLDGEGEGSEGDYFDEGDDEMDPGNEETNEIRGKRRGGKGEGRRTVVDDRFFKLAEMEQFLEKMEREEQQQKQGTRTASACITEFTSIHCVVSEACLAVRQ